MLSNRRQFLKFLSTASVALAHPSFVFAKNSTPFAGKFVLTLQAQGGWDVTCFCDPKENQPGEEVITHWSKTQRTQQAGNLSYAPVANNQVFFERHHRKILIINAVDAQTNAHSIGETANWSGRTADGYPSLTALYAAANAPHLPMSYMSFGGWSRSAGLLRPTILGHNVSQLRGFLRAGIDDRGQELVDPAIWSLIRQMHTQQAQSMLADESLLETSHRARTAYMNALQSSDALSQFAELLPDSNELSSISQGNRLISQAHYALLAFKAGVSVSADLVEGGYDSHADNDTQQFKLLGELTDALNYVWDFAEAIDIADRLIVVVGSDFSRTPHYNSGNGKDHWPVGSYLIMEKGVPYTNRVIGKTDEGQNAFALDIGTMNVAQQGGVKLLPAHVQKALRRYLGLETSTVTQAFPLINTESIDFFS